MKPVAPGETGVKVLGFRVPGQSPQPLPGLAWPGLGQEQPRLGRCRPDCRPCHPHARPTVHRSAVPWGHAASIICPCKAREKPILGSQRQPKAGT